MTMQRISCQLRLRPGHLVRFNVQIRVTVRPQYYTQRVHRHTHTHDCMPHARHIRYLFSINSVLNIFEFWFYRFEHKSSELCAMIFFHGINLINAIKKFLENIFPRSFCCQIIIISNLSLSLLTASISWIHCMHSIANDWFSISLLFIFIEFISNLLVCKKKTLFPCTVQRRFDSIWRVQ